MLLPLIIAVASVALGAFLGLGGRTRSLSALSTFAMVAALAVVLAQLLPDALSAIGLWALLVFAVAVAVPSILEKAAARLGSSDAHVWGFELGYAALVVHQVADGVGLGTYSSGEHAGHRHFDVLFAIAAHTVPVVALVAIAFHKRGGTRSLIGRCTGLALATCAGVGLPMLVRAESYAAYEPWVTAIVAGLLLHVVAHDWSPEVRRPGTAGARWVDLLAVGAGIGIVTLAGHDAHGGGDADVRHAMGEALFELSLATAPALLVGLAIGAALTTLGSRLPTAWLRSGGAFGQALRGAVVGAPLPICACGVLPLAATLRARGAGAALVVAFLIATPELGVETLALTASFVGWPFAIVRVVAAVVLAIVAALVVHRVTRASRTAFDASVVAPEPKPGISRWEGFVEAFDELLYHVAPWTVVGLIGAAYVQAVLPGGALGGLRAYGMDVFVVTLIAMPSYVCAASATPLAAVLLAKGMSPGAVLVGLLLGPATNLATIGFLRKAFGGRATLAGVAVLVMTAWLMAGVLNTVDLPIELGAIGNEEHDHGWLALLAAGLLVLALLRSVFHHGLRAWLASLGEGLGGGGSHDHDHDHHDHHPRHHHEPK